MITSAIAQSRDAIGKPPRRKAGGSPRFHRAGGFDASQPLKRWQIVKIKKLAREVWDYLLRNGAVEIEPGQSKTAAFDDWSHTQQRAALGHDGRESLNDSRQSDVRSLYSTFNVFMPRCAAVAYDQAASSGPEKEAARQALWYVRGELQRQGKLESYAEKMAEDKFGRPLVELTAGQLIKGILSTLRRRREKKLAPASPPVRGLSADDIPF